MGEVGVPPALEAAVESLRDAVTAGRTDIVRRLLDACDSCDGGGTEERIQLINSHCAEDGGTFLHLATKLGHGDIVRALLSGGGDPGVVNNKGDTPPQVATTPSVTAVYTEELLRATAQSDLGRVCQLLAGGLSVNSFDNAVSRNTPLHWAASFADTDTLQCLIARGSVVDSINSDGATPLHDAVARRDPAVVEVLLRHGAQPTAHRCTAGRHKGKTPYEMAEEKGGAVLDMMRQYTSGSLARVKPGAVSPLQKRRSPSVGGVSRGTLDMRGLAGSLESLNSIGGDSLLLTNGNNNASVIPHDQGRIAVHHNVRKSLDMGSLGRGGAVGVVGVTNLMNGVGGTQDMVPEKGGMNGHARNLETVAEGDGGGGAGTADSPQRRSKSMSLTRSPISSTSSLDLSPNMEQVYQRLVSGNSTGPPVPLVTCPRLHSLWPQPRHMTQLTSDSWTVPRHLTVALLPSAGVSLYSMCDVLEVHRPSLEECGVKVQVLGAVSALHTPGGGALRGLAATDGSGASVVCSIASVLAASNPLHYSLTITAQGVRISCGSLSSLHSAFTTLAQLLRVHTLANNKQITSTNTTEAMVTKNDNAVSPPRRHSGGGGSNLLRQSSEPHHLHGSSRAPHGSLSRSQSEVGALTSARVAQSNNAVGSQNQRNGSSQPTGGLGEAVPINTDLQIEGVVISDCPDVPYRAFMLDAAPLARIPTLGAMVQLVDTLASLKINQLHLMLRLLPSTCSSMTATHNQNINSENNYNLNGNHINGNIDVTNRSAFNFPSTTNENFTQESSENNETNNFYGGRTNINKGSSLSSQCTCPLPYTVPELLSLSRYCQDRGVTLVPAFDLDPSWSGARAAASSISEVTAAIAETLTHFPELCFVSIGPGLTSVLASSAAGCQSPTNPWECLGVTTEKTTLIVCANVFHGSATEHLRRYVPFSAVLMEYGFQADYDFSSGRATALKEGRPHAVCPGTAAWSSLAGFPEAGVSNVFKGCVDKTAGSGGASAGATCCVVVAHWSTPASLTPLVFMWPALVVGAGLAWNSLTHWDYVNSSIGSLVDEHLVGVADCGFGNALVELGRCETWLTREMRGQDNADLANLPPVSTGSGSTLHQLLADPDSVVLDNLTPEKFGSVLRHIKRSVRGIANNRVVGSLWPQMPVAASELNLAADLMMTACRLGRALVTVGSNPHSNLGMAVVNPGLAHLPPTLRTDIANRLLSLRESYSCLWLHCHQPPGLQASLLLLSSLLTRLLPHHDNIQNL